jgi:hypothetical protein
MAPTRPRNPGKPSAWLEKKARDAAEAAGVGADAVARVLQKAKEQAEANSDEHQNNMRVLGQKMEELRAKHDFNPFGDVEQPVAADTIVVQPKVIIPVQKGIKRKLPPTQAARSEDPRTKKAKVQKTQPAKEVVSETTTEDAGQKRGELREKRRSEQMKRQQEREDAEKQAKLQKGQQEKDDLPKEAKENAEKRAEKVREMRKEKSTLEEAPSSPVFAESSTADASRARTAATAATATMTANNADSTDMVPSSNLFVSEDRTDKYPVRTPLPKWYTSINMRSSVMEAMSKKRPPELTALEALKACIKQCEDTKSAVQLDKLYDDLRDHVHKAEIRLTVTLNLIRKANMLSPDYGLPRIFKQGTGFPWDLKADAYQLYNRWWKCDLNQDLLRGIVPNKTDNRTSDRLDDTYRKKFSTDAKYYGEGDLVLGQWWPTQLCTVRDGAHGSAQGGIYGEKERGAYSIVVSGGNAYHDIDNGDVIEYSGTPGKNSTPTENTVHLLTSAVLANPIRVIRSAQLNKKNKYRPELGLRYDGLYQVRGHTKIDQETAMYRFRLERCEGQDPIRFEGKAKRPTVYEVREYERLKDKGVGVW